MEKKELLAVLRKINRCLTRNGKLNKQSNEDKMIWVIAFAIGYGMGKKSGEIEKEIVQAYCEVFGE